MRDSLIPIPSDDDGTGRNARYHSVLDDHLERRRVAERRWTPVLGLIVCFVSYSAFQVGPIPRPHISPWVSLALGIFAAIVIVADSRKAGRRI